MKRLVLALLVAILAIFAAVSITFFTKNSTQTLKKETPFENIVEDVRASIVSVMSPGSKVDTMSTGFFIDKKGTIMTTMHGLEGSKDVIIILEDGKEITGRIIAQHPTLDIAWISTKYDSKPLNITAGQASLRPGHTVWTLGNVLGKYPHTLSTGIISGLGRKLSIGTKNYENMIQSSIPLTLGSSGSPLINSDGVVLGINIALEGGSSHIGWAIPLTEDMLIPQK